MVASDDKVENGKAITLSGFKKELDPPVAISGEFKKELPLMSPVSQMPYISRGKMSVGSGHFDTIRLKGCFGGQNWPSKAILRVFLPCFS